MYHPKHFQQWKRQRQLKNLYISIGVIVVGMLLFAMIKLALRAYYPSLNKEFSWSQQNSEPLSAIFSRDDPAFAIPADQLQNHQLMTTHKVIGQQTLSDIFNLYGLDPQDLLAIIKTNPQATNLSTGQIVELQQAPDGQLSSLTIHRSARLSSQFIRNPTNRQQFQFIPKRVQGTNKNRLKQGVIYQNFYHTARNMGLTLEQMQVVANALYWKIDVTKQAHLGDKLVVQISSYFVGEREIEPGKITAIWYQQGDQSYQIAQASNGELYYLDGSSVEKALDRLPLKSHFAISSQFNPHRLNPITHRYAPHYGTDIATPIGTPIYATGDGEVVKVGSHPLAGKYLVIKHDRIYSTRFLHLSQVLVREGQTISRGDKVALSGNSGRSTGPHLHYELRMNGQPVDALSAPLPNATNIPNKIQAEFETQFQQSMQKLRSKFYTPKH